VIAKKTYEKKGRDGGRKIERVIRMRFSLLSFQSNISPQYHFFLFHITFFFYTLNSIQFNSIIQRYVSNYTLSFSLDLTLANFYYHNPIFVWISLLWSYIRRSIAWSWFSSLFSNCDNNVDNCIHFVLHYLTLGT